MREREREGGRGRERERRKREGGRESLDCYADSDQYTCSYLFFLFH